MHVCVWLCVSERVCVVLVVPCTQTQLSFKIDYKLQLQAVDVGYDPWPVKHAAFCTLPVLIPGL